MPPPSNDKTTAPPQRLAVRLLDSTLPDLKKRFSDTGKQLQRMFRSGASILVLHEQKTEESIAHIENLDDIDDVIWITVPDKKNVETCKVMIRLVMTRSLIGDNYDVLVNPGPRQQV